MPILSLRQKIYIALGWFFIPVAIIGMFVPILPTTPFFVLSLTLFAKSSPRFHQMLLNNRFIGKEMQDWQNSKSISVVTRNKATLLTCVSFTFSLYILRERIYLQIFLASFGLILLSILWFKIKLKK